MNINFDNFSAYSKQLLDEIKETPKIQKTDDDSLLREQTDAFEALIVKNMLDIALKTDDSLFPKAPGHDIYQSMYKETLSQSLSGSFGFSELLFNYLKDLQK
ncbi:Rod binding protein [Helicobacter apodemus]|mgnify:CR=1 FL=1|uniref:Rod binding protein n=1 Tax=Helicobacter apodemus TaxID=135569 RepID=A0A2U8FC10_9HELI|nr:rod-binding protein [Helicobacter apodemus]AWI33791.1 Rod binding protein [Helicobacter apodemus]TLE15516.1 Rod binding protein [Helicobacter apodemus]